MARRGIVFFDRVVAVLSVVKISWRWVVLGIAIAALTVMVPQVASSRSSGVAALSLNPSPSPLPPFERGAGRGTFKRLPFPQNWEKGLGDEGIENRIDDDRSLTAQQPSIDSQFERWRSHYINNDYEAALSVLEPLLNDGETSRSIRGLAHNYLSLTHQKLGNWEAARTAIDLSLELIGVPTPGFDESTQRIFAAILNTRGQLQFALGEMELAYDSWRDATQVYRRLSDEEGVTGGMLNQAQALQGMGFARRACDTVLQVLDAPLYSEQRAVSSEQCQGLAMEDVVEIQRSIDRLENPAVSVAVLQGLGNGLRSIGEFDRSRIVLERSLKMAETIASEESIARVSLDLGNTEASAARRARELNIQQDEDIAFDRARQYYHRAEVRTASPALQLRSNLNALALIRDLTREEIHPNDIETRVRSIQTQLTALPPSRFTVEARVKFACLALNCDRLSDTEPPSVPGFSLVEVENQLNLAKEEAQQLGDDRSQAYVLEAFASLYTLQDRNFDRAKLITLQAIERAERANTREILYRLYWRMGYFSKEQNPINLELEPIYFNTLNYYKKALDILTIIQLDLNTLDPDSRFSFRDRVEPVYREYADLLLRPEAVSQEALQIAAQTIQALQIAEINDFFGIACLETQPVDLTEIDSDTATVYAILFFDRLEIIANFGGDRFYRYREFGEIGLTFEFLEISLKEKSELKSLAQQAYQKIIAPLETDLQAAEVSQIVFVLDGQLRSVPMSVLYDGERYLIEKYAIAVAPSLQLLAPKRLETPKIRVLAAGRQNFNSLVLDDTRIAPGTQLSNLKYIDDELNGIQEVADTQQLFEETFTVENLQRGVRSLKYPILHIATHGRFSNFAESTFIVVDRLLRSTELADILQVDDPSGRNDLDLVVLSACQTAQESDRAVLGMAGIAIRAGVRSIIGSLWNVNDRSTSQLMQYFYNALSDRDDFNKAEALRQAQIALIRGEAGEAYQNPHYWSPFVLVGNWR
ncbi:MAG: CHAT domain-containing protein [Cyanobacteria bacterium SBC]|nr:CHAT domain-containing protein [Cyanobacteria bacterium SBC]